MLITGLGVGFGLCPWVSDFIRGIWPTARLPDEVRVFYRIYDLILIIMLSTHGNSTTWHGLAIAVAVLVISCIFGCEGMSSVGLVARTLGSLSVTFKANLAKHRIYCPQMEILWRLKWIAI